MLPVAHDLLEHFSEACRHEVVEDWVDCRAEIEKHSRDDVHILEDFPVAVSPFINETPHEAVSVKWCPADPKNNN